MNMDMDGTAPKASPSPDREPRRPAVIVGDSMAAGSAVLADARQPELVSGLVLAGPFARDPAASDMRRALLRVAMARPWAAISCTAYLPKLYAIPYPRAAGSRPARARGQAAPPSSPIGETHG
jgi:pimeloyl-ACP methyl ester carboxylesterase